MILLLKHYNKVDEVDGFQNMKGQHWYNKALHIPKTCFHDGPI